jgi:hypothetical protein
LAAIYFNTLQDELKEADSPWALAAVIADVSAANLTDLTGDKETTMSLDLERWISSK